MAEFRVLIKNSLEPKTSRASLAPPSPAAANREGDRRPGPAVRAGAGPGAPGEPGGQRLTRPPQGAPTSPPPPAHPRGKRGAGPAGQVRRPRRRRHTWRGGAPGSGVWRRRLGGRPRLPARLGARAARHPAAAALRRPQPAHTFCPPFLFLVENRSPGRALGAPTPPPSRGRAPAAPGKPASLPPRAPLFNKIQVAPA